MGVRCKEIPDNHHGIPQTAHTQPEQTYGIPEHPLQNHKINYNGYLSRMFCIFFPTVSKSRISRVRETLTHSNQDSKLFDFSNESNIFCKENQHFLPSITEFESSMPKIYLLSCTTNKQV